MNWTRIEYRVITWKIHSYKKYEHHIAIKDIKYSSNNYIQWWSYNDKLMSNAYLISLLLKIYLLPSWFHYYINES